MIGDARMENGVDKDELSLNHVTNLNGTLAELNPSVPVAPELEITITPKLSTPRTPSYIKAVIYN